MIRFLSVDDVTRLHELTVATHGEATGIRDIGLLDAAVSMPKQTFGGEYLHDGVGAMAAAYLFHIRQAHAYVDGNKRTGVLAALVFLRVNGVDQLPLPEELEEMMLAVAGGQMDKAELTRWFRTHLPLEAPHSRVAASLPLRAGAASGPATPTFHGPNAAGRYAPSGVCSMEGPTPDG